MNETQVTSMRPSSGGSPSDVSVIHKVTITEVTEAANDVVIPTLACATATPLPVWAPGAYVDVFVDADTARQYSLWGDPANRTEWQVAVRRITDGRGGSRRMHDIAAAGVSLRVRGPRKRFPLQQPPAGCEIFLAAGIGITPLLPMVEQRAATDAAWQLRYGGRTRESMPFVNRLAGLGERVPMYPANETGRVNLDAVLRRATPGVAIYCCGPDAFIADVEACCDGRGDMSLHVERFTARPLASDVDDATFELHCATTGVTLMVAHDESILEAVSKAGIDVLSSCREGTCGTCEVDVLNGEPEHRDSFLTPQERASNETMLICVSRCNGDKLTIDL